MFSVPPATTISASPARIDCIASWTALSPEPQTLLTVKDGTSIGIPAWTLTWRATFCPKPACSTFPKINSSTRSAEIFARLIASLTTAVPSSTAETDFRLPPKLPMAVLTAETITTSFIMFSFM